MHDILAGILETLTVVNATLLVTFTTDFRILGSKVFLHSINVYLRPHRNVLVQPLDVFVA